MKTVSRPMAEENYCGDCGNILCPDCGNCAPLEGCPCNEDTEDGQGFYDPTDNGNQPG